MAEDDDSSKTEEPSARKLEEARKKGEVVLSREVVHWFMILGITLFVMLLSGDLLRRIGAIVAPLIVQPHLIPVVSVKDVGDVLFELMKTILLAILLPFLAFVVAAIAGPLLQVGPLWAPDNMMPKLERISIMSGIGRLFSKRNLLEFGKGLLKLSIVAVVVYQLTVPLVPGIDHVIDLAVADMLPYVQKSGIRILGGILAIMFVIAAIDYLAQRFMFIARLRMSRSEVKEEYKQSEGDPQIKQKLRQIRMERSRRRMMAAVPSADVVITNPDHYAVALRYNPPADTAPIVVAMGMDNLALKIKEIARENEIPIVENPPLARALYATAELEHQIPGEHFRAVAEIISYVFKLKNKVIPKAPN